MVNVEMLLQRKICLQGQAESSPGGDGEMHHGGGRGRGEDERGEDDQRLELQCQAGLSPGRL